MSLSAHSESVLLGGECLDDATILEHRCALEPVIDVEVVEFWSLC